VFRLNGTYELPKLPIPPSSTGKGGRPGEAKKRTSILGSFLPTSNKDEAALSSQAKEERSSSKEISSSSPPPPVITKDSVKKEQISSPPSSSASSNRNSVPLSNSVASTPNYQKDVEDDRYSEMPTIVSPGDLRQPTALQLTELSRETVVNDFLVVSVMKGDMVAKNKEDSKKHHGYLVSHRSFLVCDL
jgi:hypothetical protein